MSGPLIPAPEYDLIILGAGAGGLSLASELTQRPETAGWRILILDEAPEPAYTKTWCFWTDRPQDYAHFSSMQWDAMAVHGPKLGVRASIQPLNYVQVRNDDFQHYHLRRLEHHEHIDIRRGRLQAHEDTGAAVRVRTETGEFTARRLATSVVLPGTLEPGALNVWQLFRGRVIRTDRPSFDPGTATLMDFRVPQTGTDARFGYILPYSDTRALVEFTAFSASTDPAEALDAPLEDYIQDSLGIGSYETEHIETGAIPMCDAQFHRRPSPNVLTIGTAAGMVKPTTGYAFHAIQHDCARLADYLAGRRQTLPAKPHQGRFLFYDQLLLDIIQRRPARVPRIMEKLFQTNSIRQVLRFLDEQTTMPEEAAIFANLPWLDFLSAIARRTKSSAA